MLGYPLKNKHKNPDGDISDALEPLLNFAGTVVDASDQIMELEKRGGLRGRTIYSQTREAMPSIQALTIFTGLFSSWGIKLVKQKGHGSSKDISEDAILMEINVVANAVRYFERRQMKHCTRRKAESNMLWPNEFAEAERKALPTFVKDQLKLTDGAFESPESRLTTIWEIQFVDRSTFLNSY